MQKILTCVSALLLNVSLWAAQTTVTPGTGTLSAAISAATAGDILTLTTGEYIEADKITISKKLTIQAATDAKPVIKLGTSFCLKDGGLTLKNLKVDAYSTGQQLILVEGNKSMNVVLQGLEVCNFTKYMINVAASYRLDSVFIDDCYIHDMSRSVIYCYQNTSANQLPGCIYFKMTNSTALNMASVSGVAEIYIRKNSNDTENAHLPEVVMDHVTMYNVLAAYGAVKNDDGKVTISNCIFDLTKSGVPALAIANGTVSNTLFYNTTPGATFTATDTLLRDPQFANPDAANLKFMKTSPAIGAATDGSNLGDPRWGIQTEDPVYTSTCYYVTTTGDDKKDGLSWATAKATIQKAISAAKAGDTVKVASGTYNQQTITYKDGVHVFGSYSLSLGLRDVEATPSILANCTTKSVIYKATLTKETTVDGFLIQNVEHTSNGGAAYLYPYCVLSNCIIRNVVTTGSGGGVYNKGGIVRGCIIELCETSGEGGAVCNDGGIVENTIMRGCQGKYATLTNKNDGVVRNCVFYNNQPSTADWPASGGVYNSGGTVYNCTFACNYGAMYAGTHSNKVVYNSVFWNNKKEEGFSDPSTYVATFAGGTSGDNAGDDFFEAANFTLILNADNMHAAGPNFVGPTSFVGAPKNAGEIAAMRAADFSLLSTSPLIDKGRSNGAPATDITGMTRPKGTGIDIGAYEYDPDAKPVPVTGVILNVDTLFVVEESTNALAPIFSPKNATNRKVTWWIEDETIATINAYGTVTGIKIGKTRAAVLTEDGHFTDTAIVVITAKPPVHPEVLRFDTLYPISNYTIPSFIPFWIAKETARKDSSEANLQAMRDMVPTLVSKEHPYCLIANINGDPKTRMAFTWFTNEGITDGKVQLLAKANATAADFEGKEVITLNATATTTKALRYAVAESGIIKATGMPAKTAYKYESHKALADALTPGTTYCYRVGYGTFWSDIATFETAKYDQGEYSFLLMSDSHIESKEYVNNARWCAEAAVKNVPDAKFCLFPGDAEDTGTEINSEWEWERWFEESMRAPLYKMPFVVTDGNHEDTPNGNWDMHYNTDNQFNNRSLVVKPQFQGITYSFVYGDVLFLMYSVQDFWRGTYDYDKGTSTYLSTDVKNWFKDQIAAHPNTKYRVSVCHKGLFSGAGHQDDDEGHMLRTCMLPVYKECEIDLALQAHDHCYEVMGPVNPDTKTPITSAIADVQTATYDKNTNMTGKEGGTFTVDDGTLYFIGATCGRKRYSPNSQSEMESLKSKTKVDNYFDLFTSKFGQPGSPMFTKVTVKSDGIYLDSYNLNADNTNVTLYNSIKVVRTKAHTQPEPTQVESVQSDQLTASPTDRFTKIMCNGQLLIVREGQIFNVMGMKL